MVGVGVQVRVELVAVGECGEVVGHGEVGEACHFFAHVHDEMLVH